MTVYSNGQISNNISLEKKSEITISNYMCDTNSPPVFSFFPVDSIEIRDTNNVLRKSYYPFDEGRNIFFTFDPISWERIAGRNNFTKFVFFILEEDLDN